MVNIHNQKEKKGEAKTGASANREGVAVVKRTGYSQHISQLDSRFEMTTWLSQQKAKDGMRKRGSPDSKIPPAKPNDFQRKYWF